MRIALLVALGFLTACVSQKLALSPPAGVDFSGRWKLNEADSDDPQRLLMSQLDPPVANAPGATGGQGGQGRGGRGGRGGGGPGGFGGPVGPGGPAMPALGALRDGLQWPGRELEVTQVAGVVAITSAGISQTYKPAPERKRPPHHKPPDDGGGPGNRDMPNRDMPSRDRGEGPPAACGWEDKTLVVQPGSPDGDGPPFEQRYSISADGQRLFEVVAFKGGRSGGYTVSRVWDRVSPDAAPKG
jgi:hypothetical protein